MADKQYIEREAAFRAILGQPPEPHYPEWYYRNIKELPAADVVEVVHAHWIDHKNGNATCSHCRIRQTAVYDDENEQNFCGHCGAKMDGERKEQNNV